MLWGVGLAPSSLSAHWLSSLRAGHLYNLQNNSIKRWQRYISAVEIAVNLFFWFTLANSNFLTLSSVTHTVFGTGDSQELIGPYSRRETSTILGDTYKICVHFSLGKTDTRKSNGRTPLPELWFSFSSQSVLTKQQ